MTQHLTVPVHRDQWQTANGRYHHHAQTPVLITVLTPINEEPS